ncbi:MAG TPA: hypothetical protein VGV07_22360 [Devosia sp.]|uniref:hypothetical protein n=1 Tax=Devosia sp. TaxID=1871048 RepID=UPI002DDCAC38|nr:hypothetical protein [Devosia sp.]HEV2518011.1 hypothetical protein [Devosia sp.]
MQQEEAREFIIIVPTDEPGPPPMHDAILADLERNFPGCKFTVVASADLRPTYVAEAADQFVYDQMTVIPVMSRRSADSPPGVMLMNAPPAPELVEAIAKRLEAIETGKLAH